MHRRQSHYGIANEAGSIYADALRVGRSMARPEYNPQRPQGRIYQPIQRSDKMGLEKSNSISQALWRMLDPAD